MTSPRLLLLSSSRKGASGYLEPALPMIRDFLDPTVREAVFVPYAAVSFGFDDYEAKVADALAPLGLAVRSVHRDADPAAAVAAAQAIIVGGGNTFALLRRMRDAGLLPAIRAAAARGVPYVGWSAGGNLACPTIRTTNDMPVCDPGGFDALGLVGFQINPHFVSGKLPGHNGESREDRLAEFMAINPATPVLALPEGAALRREGPSLRLIDADGALLFANGKAAPLAADADVSALQAEG